MGDTYECEYGDKNPSSSSTSPFPLSSSSSSQPQDEIFLFLRQILLPSSSSSLVTIHMDKGNNAHNSMFCNSDATHQQNGISAVNSAAAITASNSAFFSGSVTFGNKGHAGSAANVSSSSVGVSENNETDDYDCESEDGVEELAEEVPTNSVPSRSSSKSRAAEVHNLSEKRRRSRINEKLKALQNLIPNSNRTDKASMLDEAIEYLKQLQLQVQMLSMRNGLSLHPMCFPEGLPLQLSKMRMELGEENRSTPLNMIATLPLHQENPLHHTSNLPNKRNMADQPSVPFPSYVINSQTSFGMDPQY